MNRRSFAEALALAALAPALSVPLEAVRLSRRPSAAPVPALGPRAPADADTASLLLALSQIIRVEYGDRLTADELAAVTEQIRAGLDRADLIRRADQGHAA